MGDEDFRFVWYYNNNNFLKYFSYKNLKIYQNNIFLFFINLFSTLTHQNDLKTQINLNQIKKIIFLKLFLKCKNKQLY